MFCYKCGRELRSDEYFCPQCGASRPRMDSADCRKSSELLGELKSKAGEIVGGLRGKMAEMSLETTAWKLCLLATLAQIACLFFMNIDIGVLRLIYQGDERWIEWILDGAFCRNYISLFEKAGVLRVLFIAGIVAAAALLLRAVISGRDLTGKGAVLAVAVPAAQLGWFVILVVAAKNSLTVKIAEALSNYSGETISKGAMSNWFKAKLTLESEAWAYLIVCAAALVLTIMAVRSGRQNREERENQERQENVMLFTDTSYAERLRRQAEEAKTERGYVICAACGHEQRAGSAFCQNCYTPLIDMKSGINR